MNARRFEIEKVSVDRLASYATVPSVCQVRSLLEIAPIDNGIDKLFLRERSIPNPYVKDYDAVDGGPLTWQRRFDLSSWEFWLARQSSQVIGAAAVTTSVGGLLDRGDERDAAILWDIRVRAADQRRGAGTALFNSAVKWAAAQGCALLRIETQNVNVAACRFYSRLGCVLEAVDPLAYRYCPQVADEVMLTWCLRL